MSIHHTLWFYAMYKLGNQCKYGCVLFLLYLLVVAQRARVTVLGHLSVEQ